MQNWLQASCPGFIETPPELKSLDCHIWTIMYGVPCCKSAINSSLSLRRLMSWKPPCKRSRKSCHRNTLTRRCGTSSSTGLPNVATAASDGYFENLQYSFHLQVFTFISSPTNRLFSEPVIDYQWRQHSGHWKMGGGCLPWNRIILLFSDIFKQNLVLRTT